MPHSRCVAKRPTSIRCCSVSKEPRSSFSARRRTARTSSTAQRADITRRLIEERGFNAVAVEADWPDAYRINCFVRGESDDPDAETALGDFHRFPRWMWRNEDVARVRAMATRLQRRSASRQTQDRLLRHRSLFALPID